MGCDFSGFQNRVVEFFILVVYDAASLSNPLSTFGTTVVPSLSRFLNSHKNALNTKAVRSLETLETFLQ